MTGAGPRPEGGSAPAGAEPHEGHERMYVPSGRLHLLPGDHDLILSAGEAAESDTRLLTRSPAPARRSRIVTSRYQT